MAGRIPAEERRRRKNEKERERKRKKKDEIRAKDRESKRRKAANMTPEEKMRYNKNAAERMRVRRATLPSEEHEKNLERERKAYNDMPQQKKQEYLMKERIAIKERRANQTEEEKQAELAANSIRHIVTKQIVGRGNRWQRERMPYKLGIKRTDPSLSAEENMKRVAHRNMVAAKHIHYAAQKKSAKTLESLHHFKAARERCVTERHFAIIDPQLKDASKRDKAAYALKSEAESMRDLTQEIYNLTTINPGHPEDQREYLIAKRDMLQAGYELAKSQKALPKTLKPVKDSYKEYERQKMSMKRGMDAAYRELKQNMRSIAERRGCSKLYNDSLDNIANDERKYKERYEQAKIEMRNDLERFALMLKEAKDTHNKACFKVEQLKEQHSSADKKYLDAFNEYARYIEDDETYESAWREHLDSLGHTCTLCNERWFPADKAWDEHERVCNGEQNMAPAIEDMFRAKPLEEWKPPEECENRKSRSKRTPQKQTLTDEDVADDFIHASTGRYKSLSDGVPDYIDPKTGYYKHGTRKCSKCKIFKQIHDFSCEELDKRANKRVCEVCWERRELNALFFEKSQESSPSNCTLGFW